MYVEITDYLVGAECSMRTIMEAMDRTGKGIILIVDDKHQLLGAITDGDLRRGVLAGAHLGMRADEILKAKPADFAEVVSASVSLTAGELLRAFEDAGVRQLPLVDEANRVVDLVTIDMLVPEHLAPLEAVIMAGGKGTRLRPLTDTLPKPMLPIGDRPILEHIVDSLKKANISNVNITTHYKGNEIRDHFGDGTDFGINIAYVVEDEPLGTAGGLNLMNEKPTEPVLVLNGDILTQVDFRAMFDYHRDHGADLTVAVSKYDVEVPYGVIDCVGANVRALKEKPVYNFFVNAGIYLLDPVVWEHLPKGHINMTDVVDLLIKAGRTVVSFPILEYWLDIGQHDQYEQAQGDIGRIQQGTK
jgi:dTDP-glucose pyrophosphorylase/predicted transcriptional regulator